MSMFVAAGGGAVHMYTQFLKVHWVILENIHTSPAEETNPPNPFGHPNTLTFIRNSFFSPPDGKNFLLGEGVVLCSASLSYLTIMLALEMGNSGNDK